MNQMNKSGELWDLLISFGFGMITGMFGCWLFNLVYHDDAVSVTIGVLFFAFIFLATRLECELRRIKEELKKYTDMKVEESYTELSFKIGDAREEHERKMHHE